MLRAPSCCGGHGIQPLRSERGPSAVAARRLVHSRESTAPAPSAEPASGIAARAPGHSAGHDSGHHSGHDSARADVLIIDPGGGRRSGGVPVSCQRPGPGTESPGRRMPQSITWRLTSL